MCTRLIVEKMLQFSTLGEVSGIKLDLLGTHKVNRNFPVFFKIIGINKKNVHTQNRFYFFGAATATQKRITTGI